jgi:hypothetical protein
MRWVQSARLYPQKCAVWPHVGATHPAGYIDTHQTTPSGERIYVSVAAASAIAEGLGFVRPGDESSLHADNKRLADRVAGLELELAARGEELAAVHVLRRGGFASSAKTGPKQKAVA